MSVCTLQEPDEFCGKQLFALINDEVSNFLKSRYLCIWKNGGPSIEVAGTNQRIAHAPGKKDRQRCDTWKFFDMSARLIKVQQRILEGK